MVKKIEVAESSKRWRFNKTDSVKIIKSVCLALSGPFLDVISSTIFNIDFGQYTSIVYVITPVVINTVRKLIQGEK